MNSTSMKITKNEEIEKQEIVTRVSIKVPIRGDFPLSNWSESFQEFNDTIYKLFFAS